MDPQIIRPREAMCPICNMALVPKQEGDGTATEPGVLSLSDRQVQQAGVRLDRAQPRPLARSIDTTGRLEIIPNNRTLITVRYPGKSRIERLHRFAAGDRIQEGDVLAEVQNDDMTQLLEDYRTALKQYEGLRRAGQDGEAPAALMRMNGIKKQFEEYGLPGGQVTILAAKAKHLFSEQNFPVLSPINGALLADPLFQEGQPAYEGTVLFDAADLNSLWLILELYEHELPLVAVRDRVSYSTLAIPEASFETTIRTIEPILDERTRTVRARCRVGSLNGQLAPGMFVRARILAEAGEPLSVPTSAVLSSGTRDVVIVSEGGGRFRPKLVRLGRRHLSLLESEDDTGGLGAAEERYHEILEGLKPGERVVVSGNFLLQAEAQFQGVLQKMIDAEEAQSQAPGVAPALAEGIDALFEDYFAISTALVQDEPSELAELARSLGEKARELAPKAGDLEPLLSRLAEASDALGAVEHAAPEGLEAARTPFGSLSREVVAYLSEYAPARVASGDLFVFRCPMAADFGFKLWIQPDESIANPYMGQAMPECGAPTELP